MFNYITFPTSMDYYSSDIDNKRFQFFTVYRLQSNTKCENKPEHNFKPAVAEWAWVTAHQHNTLPFS